MSSTEDVYGRMRCALRDFWHLWVPVRSVLGYPFSAQGRLENWKMYYFIPKEASVCLGPGHPYPFFHLPG